ncbi:MAG: RNase adaptor protein RapZ, partial [Myxococcota bacterium]|nr:RNase adaptor protein RapZ [Myxococcota bacterium]
MSEAGVRIVFVSGLSGSGRTTAMGALEDLGFYGVDNIPPQLIEQFVDLCAKANPPIRDIALALDAREAAFLKGFPSVVQAIRATGARADVLFLDCADEVLVSRYRETRRVHPLAPAGT